MLIQENFNLTPLTTFSLPAQARYFAEYDSVDTLKKILKTPEYQSSEVLHIGGGSNLLFTGNFEGIVLHSAIKGIKEYKKDSDHVYLIAGAGEKWEDLVSYAVGHGLAGLENLAAIPGEVGASAVQNVGAYGVEAKDVIFKVECYDRLSHTIVTFRNEECRFGYRDSIFKNEAKGRYFVLRVCFRLKETAQAAHLDYGPLKDLTTRLGHTPTIAEVHHEVTLIRNNKLPDPAQIGSAGSFFKNPIVHRLQYTEEILPAHPDMPHYDVDADHVKIPAGWLIEHAGLKGLKIGAAQVYPKQCLVLTNTGGATASQVVELCHRVQEEVFRKFAIRLRPEVNIITSTTKVTVLGSGTSQGVPRIGCGCKVCTSTDPRDKRLRASIYIETQGQHLLIDASPDFRQQMLRENINQIDALLLTHSHYDHVGGIDDLRPFCAQGDIPIYLRKDVADDLKKRIDYCFREPPYPGVPTFRLHPIGTDPFYINGVKIVPISVMHAGLPIVGYRIGRFAYITDAKTIAAAELAKLEGVEVLIINALRFKPHFSHFSVEEALQVIEQVKPKEAYLTHMCHEFGLHADTAALLPPGVSPAYDGLHLTI